jgi:hypothetical protein
VIRPEIWVWWVLVAEEITSEGDCVKHISITAPLLALIAAACTPAQLTPLKIPEASKQSEIIVFREPALNAAASELVFGADDTDYVTLRNGNYAQMYLDPRTYRFFVRSIGADQPYVLTVTLNPNDHKCFKAYANPSNLAKAALFALAYYMGNTFLLEESACLSAEDLSEYSKVDVQYQNK